MTEDRHRFLMTMWEGGGTLPPELAIARRLLAQGHQVHVLGDPTIRERAEALGCGFSAWQRAPHRTSLHPDEDLLRDWEVRSPLTMLKRVRDTFIAGPAADFAADTLDTIEEVGPDAVVPDFMLFGTIIGAQAAGLPVAPVVPNIWSIPTPGAPAIGPGFPLARTTLGRTRDRVMLGLANRLFGAGLPTLNQARAAHGLPPLGSFYDQVLDTDRILVLTSPTFDFSSPHVPDNVRYVGPILDDPDWVEPWTPPWPDALDGPVVLVAMSATFQDQGPLLRRVVQALSDLPVRGIVTLGQMLAPDVVPPAANVAVVPSAPHAQILPHADVVITHCGHGTTLKSLAAGVPLVCLPMGRDQNDTAARVDHHGAGVRLAPRASVGRIRTAVQQVLEQAQFGDAAGRLATTIARECADINVVSELESVVRAGLHTKGAGHGTTAAD
jgi:MGT family glycosyltransferase